LIHVEAFGVSLPFESAQDLIDWLVLKEIQSVRLLQVDSVADLKAVRAYLSRYVFKRIEAVDVADSGSFYRFLSQYPFYSPQVLPVESERKQLGWIYEGGQCSITT